jgi:hypothetical protein
MPEIFPTKLNVINVESVESLNDRCYIKPMMLPLRLEQQLLVNEYP